MKPIALSQNHNPKNQLSFMPFKQAQADQFIHQVKVQEVVQKKLNENRQQLSFYEQQIQKLSYTNAFIMAQLSSALEQKKIIMRLISQAQKRQDNELEIENQKRVRRCAKEVERKHQCSEKGCEKWYGSGASLLQHVRLKHPKTNTDEPPLMLDPA